MRLITALPRPRYTARAVVDKVALPLVPENRQFSNDQFPDALLEKKPSAMNDPSDVLAKAASDIEEAAHAGLVPQLTMMVKALWASQVRNKLLLLGGEHLRRHRRRPPTARSASTAGTSPSTTRWRGATSPDS